MTEFVQLFTLRESRLDEIESKLDLIMKEMADLRRGLTADMETCKCSLDKLEIEVGQTYEYVEITKTHLGVLIDKIDLLILNPQLVKSFTSPFQPPH